jgi:hypothetical protein
MDVPLYLTNLPSGTEELIWYPGASNDSFGLELEKQTTLSLAVGPFAGKPWQKPESFDATAPTLTAEERQAGDDIVLLLEKLPLATTGATPWLRRLAIAACSAGFVASQSSSKRPPPRLMFTEAMEKLPRKLSTCSRPAIRSDHDVVGMPGKPLSLKTWIAMMLD